MFPLNWVPEAIEEGELEGEAEAEAGQGEGEGDGGEERVEQVVDELAAGVAHLRDDEAAAHVCVERAGHVEEAAHVAAEDVVGRVDGPGEAGGHGLGRDSIGKILA